ncbi:hypothetical protein GCM10020360_31520 [Nonlabens tegetincola]
MLSAASIPARAKNARKNTSGHNSEPAAKSATEAPQLSAIVWVLAGAVPAGAVFDGKLLAAALVPGRAAATDGSGGVFSECVIALCSDSTEP